MIAAWAREIVVVLSAMMLAGALVWAWCWSMERSKRG